MTACEATEGPRWVCECGNEARLRGDDEVVHLGRFGFRRKPCPACRRPMQLSRPAAEGDGDWVTEGEG